MLSVCVPDKVAWQYLHLNHGHCLKIIHKPVKYIEYWTNNIPNNAKPARDVQAAVKAEVLTGRNL